MALTKPKQRGIVGDDVVIELPERSHLEGCPMDDERLDWETQVPATGPHAGVEMIRIRCVQCGGEILRPLDD